MAIYAMGDLHFSGEPPTKPMEVFGAQWLGHREKVITYWKETVKDGDTVLLVGDTSWSMDLEDAVAKDLGPLAALPGDLVILKGNHDYWWNSLKKLQAALPPKVHFLHNTFYQTGDVALCGTRGWNLPSMPGFGEHDQLVYARECQRLERSLAGAREAGAKHLIAALHYPPLYNPEEVTGFTELCKKYQVEQCIYGHVHGDAAHFLNLFQGERDGTRYRLVAADYVDFHLVKICD